MFASIEDAMGTFLPFIGTQTLQEGDNNKEVKPDSVLPKHGRQQWTAENDDAAQQLTLNKKRHQYPFPDINPARDH